MLKLAIAQGIARATLSSMHCTKLLFPQCIARADIAQGIDNAAIAETCSSHGYSSRRRPIVQGIVLYIVI